MFPYVDGELAPATRDQVEAHLADCPACRRLVDLEIAFREAYVEPLRPDPTPEPVREQIDALLAGIVRRRKPGQRALRVSRLAIGLSAAGLIALGAGLGVALHAYWDPRATVVDLAEAAVEQHQKLVRDLLPADIKDVSPKAAEEWFKKRLAFNVSLPDLKSDSLQFLGGRISHLRDIEVAALEYQIEGNNVSLFIIPEEAYRRLHLSDRPRFKVISQRGYHVVVWRSQGAGYTLVSEIGDRACLVCHGPHEKLEPLPRPSAHL